MERIKQLFDFVNIQNIIYIITFFYLFNYIQYDAELFILLSVFLFFLSVWNVLSKFLGTFLFVKSTCYYYYFLRYYHARLWIVFLTSKYIALSLYVHKLPLFLQCYAMNVKKIEKYLGVKGKDLLSSFNNYLNYYSFLYIRLIMINLWLNFYKLYINLYISLTNQDHRLKTLELNRRKVVEYALANRYEMLLLLKKSSNKDDRAYLKIYVETLFLIVLNLLKKKPKF